MRLCSAFSQYSPSSDPSAVHSELMVSHAQVLGHDIVRVLRLSLFNYHSIISPHSMYYPQDYEPCRTIDPYKHNLTQRKFERKYDERKPRIFSCLLPNESVTKSYINPSALEMDIQITAHHLCKTWILYKPKKVTLWNTRHSVQE